VASSEEPWLLRAVEIARRAWPGVEVDVDAFARHVAERAGAGAQDTLHLTDLYLACACAAGSAAALAAFDARYVAEVPLFLAGVETDSASIDEVRQLLRERLFVAGPERTPKIFEYSGRGTLGSWLRVVTLRIAFNRRRGEKNYVPFDAEAEDLLRAADPDLAVLRARYRDDFGRALRQSFADLAPRERLLLRMHFVDGLTLDQMGLVFQVHRATVARWLAGAREAVFERTMTALGDGLRLDAAEFASLFRAVRSDLDVSLQGLLEGHVPES
jgi:RNA polymerase sigma-70 factor, ECF subfamily